MTDRKGDILAQPPSRTGLARQLFLGFLLLCGGALTVVTAFGIAPGATTSNLRLAMVRDSVELPETQPVVEQSPRYVSQERVLRGDTVAALFDRLGVSDPKAFEFLKTDATGKMIFRQLVREDPAGGDGLDGELLALLYFVSSASLLEANRTPEGIKTRQRAITEEPRLVYKTATIRSSLFGDRFRGNPDAIAMQLARLFATDIDFHTEPARNDRFSVLRNDLQSRELIAPDHPRGAVRERRRVHTRFSFGR